LIYAFIRLWLLTEQVSSGGRCGQSVSKEYFIGRGKGRAKSMLRGGRSLLPVGREKEKKKKDSVTFVKRGGAFGFWFFYMRQ